MGKAREGLCVRAVMDATYRFFRQGAAERAHAHTHAHTRSSRRFQLVECARTRGTHDVVGIQWFNLRHFVALTVMSGIADAQNFARPRSIPR